MEIQFKYNNIEEGAALSVIAEQKLSSLKKFLTRADAVLCDAEFDKVAPQQNGQVHQFKVNLQVGGELYRAEAVEESFEAAIDEVRDELDKELRRAKNKKGTLARRAGRALKEIIWRQ